MGVTGNKLLVPVRRLGGTRYRCPNCGLHEPASEICWLPQATQRDGKWRSEWWCLYCIRIGGRWDDRGGSLDSVLKDAVPPGLLQMVLSL